MSIEANAYDLMPSASEVAARYALATGELSAMPGTHAWPFSLHMGFAVAGYGAEQAHVVAEQEFFGQPLPVRSLYTMPIGQFNPADGRWRFAPEYVPPESHEVLGDTIAETLLPTARLGLIQAMASGQAALDVHNPFTQAFRADMAARLAALEPHTLPERPAVREGLAASGSNPSPVIGADEYTFCFPTFSGKVSFCATQESVGLDDYVTTLHPVFGTTRLLTLCFSGLKVAHHQNLGYTARALRTVVVAEQSADDPDVWLPDLERISPDDWDVLRHLPAVMEQAGRDNPKFSPFIGSVAYGIRLP